MSAGRKEERAARLLQSAVAFASASVEPSHVPDTFHSIDDVIGCMSNVLWCDAHHALRTPLEQKPEDCMLHAVDMHKDSPGIVLETAPKLKSFRMEAGDIAEWQPEARGRVDDREAVEIVSRPIASARGPTLEKQRERVLKKMQTQALRDEAHDEKAIAKLEEKKRKRESLANETPDQRRERLALAKEERERKKREKADLKKQEDAEAAERSDDQTERDDENETSAAKKGDEDDDVKGKKRASRMDLDDACERNTHRILPPKIRMRDVASDAEFFCSPVPLDRHISSLAQPDIGLSDALDRAVRLGEPSDRLQIIQGPPGTGKTTALLQVLRDMPFRRALVCAPSNVAVLNLYRKLVDSANARETEGGISLCIPPSKIPEDVIVCSNDPTHRIVCATVSGRNGRQLAEVGYDAIFVDEAAQLPEAMLWTMLRKDVTRVVMAGDVQQLRGMSNLPDAAAFEHDRSMMERLIDRLDYPCRTLTRQHRMRPEICQFPNEAFYDGVLESAKVELPGSYACLAVPDGTCEAMGTSFVNRREADVCLQVAEGLAQKGIRRVAIVCAYHAQCRHILSKRKGFTVHTVDSFQGSEDDAVVLSVVRTGNDCGFWKDERRLVVALTRARERMFVVGSFDWNQGPLRMLCDDAKRRNVLHTDVSDALNSVATTLVDA